MAEASTDWSYRELANFKGRANLEVTSGTTPGDILRNDTLLLVVTDRLLEVLRSNKIEAFSTYRVKVTLKGKEISGYNGLAILGKGGPNDSKAYVDGPMPGTNIRRIRGLYPTKWDGSDLLMLDDLFRVVLVTERLKRLLENARVTNCLFERAEDFAVGYPGRHLKATKR
jgi:hypothetical protein